MGSEIDEARNIKILKIKKILKEMNIDFSEPKEVRFHNLSDFIGFLIEFLNKLECSQKHRKARVK